MKLILIHADPLARQQIRQQLEKLNHVVVAEPSHPGELLLNVAKHQPHAIIAGELPPALTKPALEALHDHVPTPVVWLSAGVSAESRPKYFESALAMVASNQASQKCRPYSCNDQRFVLHDDRYKPFTDGQKLGEISASQSDPKRESELFVRQVGCAVRNHQAARRYLAQLLITDRALRVECAYRAVHASYKIYWLREHALRFVSVLAHYIEGVEIEYLPSPASPSPTLDWLDYDLSPYSRYAAEALISHGFQSDLLPEFRRILDLKFTGQPGILLAADAVVLFGWCAFLREVARAQVEIMDQILDLKSDWHALKKPTRRIHRAEGIIGDWAALPWLRQNPERMRELARLALLEQITPSSPGPVIAPFREFPRTQQAAKPEEQS